ncbi:MAG: hypothetical protein JXR97_01230 [Planctomycetes bacterium]|nr:hypothetical protein [Planctomycetota bacterium]
MSEKQNHDWTLEREGMAAVLLRRLARCDAENDCHTLIEELRQLTGLDYGPNLGKWLSWYLEEHLGMRNSLAILSGKGVPEYTKNENLPLLEEQVFDRAEYNWCALERIKNKDDMLKLRALYSDLESPILTEAEGSLSFRRLTGADTEDLEFFGGKSISQAIFDDAVMIRHLRLLKDYGKMMMMPLFPSATQRTGAIVYAAAISQALVKFETKITSLSFKDLTESLPGLVERPYVVESYVNLFRTAMEKCV